MQALAGPGDPEPEVASPQKGALGLDAGAIHAAIQQLQRAVKVVNPEHDSGTQNDLIDTDSILAAATEAVMEREPDDQDETRDCEHTLDGASSPTTVASYGSVETRRATKNCPESPYASSSRAGGRRFTKFDAKKMVRASVCISVCGGVDCLCVFLSSGRWRRRRSVRWKTGTTAPFSRILLANHNTGTGPTSRSTSARYVRAMNGHSMFY